MADAKSQQSVQVFGRKVSPPQPFGPRGRREGR